MEQSVVVFVLCPVEVVHLGAEVVQVHSAAELFVLDLRDLLENLLLSGHLVPDVVDLWFGLRERVYACAASRILEI